MTRFLLLLYGGWWLYVFHFIYWKEYDDGNAAATATMGIGCATVFITAVYLAGFLIAAVRFREKRKAHLLTAALLLAPVAGMYLVEALT